MHKGIKALTNECCNLFDNGYCVFKEKKCVVRDDKPCKWFEEYVLPIDEALKVLYFKTLQTEAHGDSLSKTQQQAIIQENSKTIKCGRCPKEFKPSSNRQKFCDDCKKIVNREQARLRMQTRKNKDSLFTL